MSRRLKFERRVDLADFRGPVSAPPRYIVRVVETRKGGDTVIVMETTEPDFDVATRRADSMQEGIDDKALPLRAYVMNAAGDEVLHAGGAPLLGGKLTRSSRIE